MVVSPMFSLLRYFHFKETHSFALTDSLTAGLPMQPPSPLTCLSVPPNRPKCGAPKCPAGEFSRWEGRISSGRGLPEPSPVGKRTKGPFVPLISLPSIPKAFHSHSFKFPLNFSKHVHSWRWMPQNRLVGNVQAGAEEMKENSILRYEITKQDMKKIPGRPKGEKYHIQFEKEEKFSWKS